MKMKKLMKNLSAKRVRNHMPALLVIKDLRREIIWTDIFLMFMKGAGQMCVSYVVNHLPKKVF